LRPSTFNKGQVGGRVDSDHGRGHLALVRGQRHRDRQVLQADALCFAGDDVVVGQDVAVGADHDARSEAALDAAAVAEDVLVAEEQIEGRGLTRHELPRRDVRHGRHRAPRRCG
jgi:hypothetical protein